MAKAMASPGEPPPSLLAYDVEVITRQPTAFGELVLLLHTIPMHELAMYVGWMQDPKIDMMARALKG